MSTGPSTPAAAQPAWLEPELATLTKARFSDPAWFYERNSTASAAWPTARAIGSGS